MVEQSTQWLCRCGVLREFNLPHALFWLKAAVASETAHNKGKVTAMAANTQHYLINAMAKH